MKLNVILFQLTELKDRENKGTLMHFLVEICERDHPDLLSFADELIHLDDASGIDAGEIKKSLNQMDSNIKNLERDLENAGRVQNKDPDDR